MKYKELSNEIINAFYKVYNHLGFGFLEKVYEHSLYFELTERGINCTRQHKINVYYKDQQIGFYYADIIVENKIILEIKAADSLCKDHELQLINYLKATEIEIGLLLNFGKQPQFKRKIFTNAI